MVLSRPSELWGGVGCARGCVCDSGVTQTVHLTGAYHHEKALHVFIHQEKHYGTKTMWSHRSVCDGLKSAEWAVRCARGCVCDSGVTQTPFKGCIKDVQLGTLAKDLNENKEFKDVSPGCTEVLQSLLLLITTSIIIIIIITVIVIAGVHPGLGKEGSSQGLGTKVPWWVPGHNPRKKCGDFVPEHRYQSIYNTVGGPRKWPRPEQQSSKGRDGGVLGGIVTLPHHLGGVGTAAVSSHSGVLVI